MTVTRAELRAALALQGAPQERIDALYPESTRKPPRKREPGELTPEGQVLREVLRALRLHPRVAWVRRMQGGVADYGGTKVRYGGHGLPDVIGQLRDGRFLAVECKSATGQATDEQVAFLREVASNHGVAILARCAADVFTGELRQ